MAQGHGTASRTLAYGLVYLACTLAMAFWLPTYEGNLSPLLHVQEAKLLVLALLSLPAIAGVLLQLLGRRLWTWPYVYLLSLAMVHTASGIDEADRIYLYSSQLATILAIALAETIGLSLGRWLNRPSAIGYFCAVGVIQICYAFSSGDHLLSDWIEQVTFSVAGAMFLVQCAIQLYINRKAVSASEAGKEKQSDQEDQGKGKPR